MRKELAPGVLVQVVRGLAAGMGAMVVEVTEDGVIIDLGPMGKAKVPAEYLI